MEKRGCAFNEIPTKPNAFSTELRNILGSSRGKILGAASILEEAILEALCAELKIALNSTSATSFADHIKKLREVYNKKRYDSARITFKGGSSGSDPFLRQLPTESRG